MQFAEFFTQMHWSVIMLVVIAIAFLFIELVVPGFGFWGVIGIMAGIAAVVCEAVFTKSVFDVFFLIFLLLVIFAIAFAIFSHSFRKGMLKKTPLVENHSALPENYGKNTQLDALIGKQGKVVTQCKPVGKARIEGQVYTVTSVKGNIYQGELIKVVEIKDNIIKVEYLGGEDE